MPQDSDAAEAFWTVAPGRGAILPAVAPPPGPGEVRVRTLVSGVSRGTESLVFAGRVPESEHARMRAPFQEGDFPFPVKYGYAAVGIVEDGEPELVGRAVFALYPHQTRFTLPAAAVTPLPSGLAPARGVLAANMETALNALWDAGAGPGDRIAVVGAGTVGTLTAALAGRIAGTDVTLVDIDPARAEAAHALGLRFSLPDDAPGDADVVLHATGHDGGLDTALRLAGDEATVVEMSWYGDRPVQVALGGAFHALRLRLLSSQVGRVSASRRTRWSYRRRLAKALDLLADDRLDALIGPVIDFHAMPDRLPPLLAEARPDPAVPARPVHTVMIRYPASP
jgi:NADPH:quinone reductase-like Zn-dependent oxidoreductase